MQERDKNQHYSDQRGHAERGAANRFKKETGFKPSVFANPLPEIVCGGDVDYFRRRSMRRITQDGRG